MQMSKFEVPRNISVIPHTFWNMGFPSFKKLFENRTFIMAKYSVNEGLIVDWTAKDDVNQNRFAYDNETSHAWGCVIIILVAYW